MLHKNRQEKQVIFIMAGGTGGHIYPALAVADYLSAQGQAIKWLGTETGLEARVVPENGYSLLTIDIGGVRGKGVVKKLMAPFIILRAILQSVCIFIKHKPAAVLGMGGFASGPGGIAAWLLRIPVLIHEQNAIAGLTNKILSKIARTVMQAFPGAFKDKDKIHTTGNPVRKDILNVLPPNDRFKNRDNEFNLLIIGGSLGAKRLNEVVPLALADLASNVSFNVQHQSGDKHIDETKQHYVKAGVEAELKTFINDMAEAYAWADIVICRAGAMTIAELSIVGVPSILVPFPYAVDDHQTANAHYLSDEGCAILIQETDLSIESLSKALAGLCQSRQKLLEMADKARSLSMPKATELVAGFCMEAAYV